MVIFIPMVVEMLRRRAFLFLTHSQPHLGVSPEGKGSLLKTNALAAGKKSTFGAKGSLLACAWVKPVRIRKKKTNKRCIYPALIYE